MPQKLIIDADPGIGDALAIAVALFDPEIDLIGVTATSGCVSGPVATRNIQAIIEALDPPKWPRIGSCDRETLPTLRDFATESVSTSALNGPSGLGDWDFRVAELASPKESAKLLIELVRAEPLEITLLTLGPLTNIALALDRAPDFLDLLRGIVVLGGSVTAGGDVTPAAEFNIFSNPEAARVVLGSPATKTLVPRDVSSVPVLTFDQHKRLPHDESTLMGKFLQSLLPFALRAHHQHLGLEGMRLNEVAAVAAIARPEMFQAAPMAVDVETKGELTRGMTVFDRRGQQHWKSNIDVLREVESQAIIDYLTATLKRGAAGSSGGAA